MPFQISKAFILAAGLGGAVLAADRFPDQALPLSEVLFKVEQAGMTQVVEASFDDGIWEIEGFRGANAVEIHVDPLTGRTVSEHPERIEVRPGTTAKNAREIARLLEDAGYRRVKELDWKRDHWEAEAITSTGERKLHIAADTGKVLTDFLDD